MKNYTILKAILGLPILAIAQLSFGQLNIPSDGSDGALNVTANTVIDLSQAVTESWTNNDSANAGNGIYDPTQWAVVFKYSSVNIAANATVTFLNHYSRAPVVWLVQSNVTINGTVSLNGNSGNGANTQAAYEPTEPGPGGFRAGAYDSAIGGGDGFGPGGEVDGVNGNATYQSTYGNPQILPLIGGSGSFGNNCASGFSGGGAILIAAAGTVTVNGEVNAVGAAGGCNLVAAGGGIRIVANQIAGNGSVNSGFQGRTRVEANSISSQLTITPNAALVSPGSPPLIFPPTNSPTVSIVSIAGLAAPADPRANVTASPDVSFATNNAGPVTVVLQTQNFSTTGSVSVRVVPVYGASSSLSASYVSGTSASATWQLTAPIPLGYCVLQAHATAQ
jgi:hypothetical protein